MFKIFILLSIFVVNTFSEEFEEYLQQYNTSYNKYKNNINLEFESYKKAHDTSFKDYKKNIANSWNKVDFTTKHTWVEYTNNYQNKKIIDYKKGKVLFEVIAKNEKFASMQILKMFDNLKDYNIKDAYMNDILERKISFKLDLVRVPPNSNQKLISDIISKEKLKAFRTTIEKQEYKVIKHKDNYIYQASIKLPSNFILQKAKLYKQHIYTQSKLLNIPAEFIYAIIHSESSFNPMARSYIPAFGLMQIVPKSAGIDAIYYLEGEKKLLSSKYLYNPKNNIQIGSVYLNILYYKYLKNIKDKQSRLYCTICAYNTGSGNVARAFIGTTNIKKAIIKINKLSSDQVYKRLIKKLPYKETKKYLFKVNKRIKTYSQLINEKKL